ncbi:hypothetical protein [Prescottella equi]|uniref:hypothetical protein n=1 Tax=Rhodococcus hoagii TaxID=43767 RepID=UPI001C7409F3|nr:hypothetical protein [Prescottella equi]BCN45252.1 hypothetical protein RE9414_35320 [Prescottella equi]
MGKKTVQVSDAEVIDAFLRRADRVLTDEIVKRAELGTDFRLTVRVRGAVTELRTERIDEQLLDHLAMRMRPFLPWVSDSTGFNNTRQVVRRSLTDHEWRRRSDVLAKRCRQAFEADQVIHFARDKEGELKWHDHEMAKAVINGVLFHEETDPRVARLLNLDISQPFNNQSVLRMLNTTVCAVKLLQRFILDADKAGVLSPQTRAA